jgi:hypothetical protein
VGELAGLKGDKTDRNKLKDPGFAPQSGNTTRFIESHKIAGLLKKKVFFCERIFQCNLNITFASMGPWSHKNIQAKN